MRFSLHDGPGIRTTVFLKGCPLRCPWCHNPESQEIAPSLMLFEERCLGCGDCAAACPSGAIPDGGGAARPTAACLRCGACAETCPAEARQLCGREMTVAAVVREVERDLAFFEESGGGVTLSGGEPLAQPAFAEALLAAFHERRIHTALDTSGFAARETLLRIARAADLVLYDLKVLDAARHEEHTGVPVAPIIENLQALAATGRPVIVRYPLVPGVNDAVEDVDALACLLLRLGLRRVDVLPYHRIGIDKRRRLGAAASAEFGTPAPERVRRVADDLEAKGLSVRIGG